LVFLWWRKQKKKRGRARQPLGRGGRNTSYSSTGEGRKKRGRRARWFWSKKKGEAWKGRRGVCIRPSFIEYHWEREERGRKEAHRRESPVGCSKGGRSLGIIGTSVKKKGRENQSSFLSLIFLLERERGRISRRKGKRECKRFSKPDT